MSVDELTLKEKAGQLEDEKTFYSKSLGGNFVFRLPFIFDELNVLRRRAQIIGVPESTAGPELLATAHAQALYETYLVQAPHKFDLSKLRSWGPFLRMMGEVQTWHQDFFQNLGDEEE